MDGARGSERAGSAGDHRRGPALADPARLADAGDGRLRVDQGAAATPGMADDTRGRADREGPDGGGTPVPQWVAVAERMCEAKPAKGDVQPRRSAETGARPGCPATLAAVHIPAVLRPPLTAASHSSGSSLRAWLA